MISSLPCLIARPFLVVLFVFMMITSFSTATILGGADQGFLASSVRVGTRAALARYPWWGTRTHGSRSRRTVTESTTTHSLSRGYHSPTLVAGHSLAWTVIPTGGGFQKKRQSKDDDRNVLVQLVQDSFNPGSLSYGFVTGYVSGVALKTVGRASATILGVGFISLQVLAYNGIIQVNHSVIEEKLEAMLDLNRDGRVCRDDGALLTDRVLNILQHNLPSAGGFVAGFMGGINFG